MPTPPSANPAVERLVAEASRRLQRNDPDSAYRVALEALAIRKNHPGAIQVACGALNILRRHDEALDLLARIRAIVHSNPPLLFQSAYATMHLGRPDEGIAQFEQILKISPGFPEVPTQIAIAHAVAGRHAHAIELLEPIVRETGSHSATTRLASSLRMIGRAADAVDLLSRALAQPGCSAGERRVFLFARSDAYDALREVDLAWADLVAAGELGDPQGYDPDLFTSATDRVLRSWTADVHRDLPIAPARADRTIFVLGMWRSGTTLVEQILASHPRIAGAGELKHFLDLTTQIWPADRIGGVQFPGDPGAIRTAQLQSGSAAHARALFACSMDATRVIDKLPVNSLHLGLISRTCPGSRVVRCLRSPLDTCLSCLFQMRGKAAPYCTRADWLGRFYRDAARLTDHWASIVDLPIHAVTYESLVADLESHARSLADFVGVPWDDRMKSPERNSRVAMTRSIDQVRKPVYTSSIGRWKAYERHLGPLIDALGPLADRA